MLRPSAPQRPLFPVRQPSISIFIRNFARHNTRGTHTSPPHTMTPFRPMKRLLWLTCLLYGCVLWTQAGGTCVGIHECPCDEQSCMLTPRVRHCGLADTAEMRERPRDGLAAVRPLPLPAEAALLPEAWSVVESCAPRHGSSPCGHGGVRQCGRTGFPYPSNLCHTPPHGGIKAESQGEQPPAVAGADYVLRLRRLLC